MVRSVGGVLGDGAAVEDGGGECRAPRRFAAGTGHEKR
jgi:hypothetical protein